MQNHFKIGKNFSIFGINSSADSIFISKNFNFEKVLLIICNNIIDVERIYQELTFLMPNINIDIFSNRELLPYDQFSPHADLISQRLLSLYNLINNKSNIVLTTAATICEKIAPLNFLAKYTFDLSVNEKFNEEAFKNQMTIAGYNRVATVMHTGEYCIRGGIIDVFPMGSVLPYRIDLFDNIIESIKVFNIDSQRSLYNVQSIKMLPSKEYAFDKNAQNKFLYNFQHKFKNIKSSIFKNMEKGIAVSGIESYIPLFFDNEMANFFEYLPKNSHVITIGNISESLNNLYKDASNHYNFFSSDIERPLLPVEDLFLKEAEFFSLLAKFARVSLKQELGDKNFSQAINNIYIENKKQNILSNFINFYETYSDYTILVCAESLGRLDVLQNLFNQYNLSYQLLDSQDSNIFNLKAGIYLQQNTIQHGFIYLTEKIVFICEENLYQNYIKKNNRKSTSTSDIDNMVKDLSELNIDDAIVHNQYGIGRYQGLIGIDTGSGQEDFIHITYAKDTNLYVPIQNLNLISRYAGYDSDNISLNTLGSDQWEKAKKKAAEKIYDTAAELLELYAKRGLRKGNSIEFDEIEYEKFSNSFGFNTTADQETAIQNVIKDLVSPKSMDRLICGDVGFGKTEVAMRAAFIAATSGKQVLILTPTTLLAEQHYQNFTNRFSPWAIKIAEFSRFKTPKEIKQNVQELNAGKIDIAIGTHKLLSNDIKAPNLGLIIVDEEHRFGVRQKELIKNIRTDVDLLSLTATPIPRTLGMALEGLREFSVIATAPQKRLSVKTFVRLEDKSIIREAILREIKRGGQVYFVHNDIDTINFRKKLIEEIVPEAHVKIAHGQMPERELEQVMKDFHHQKFNVLLCTTIIETGIDIANANTIILNRADKFGLAQLHQLRGRVGRSHHQAYAYLLVHDFSLLTNSAKKRLDAISGLQELGCGFYLAMQDLEIRGAGEILGEKQSGEMQSIGFNLYTDMLNHAIKSLKQGKKPDLMKLEQNVEISMGSPSVLPQEYMFDVHSRLSFYNSLASSKTYEEIYLIREDIIDQYGRLPSAGILLIYSHLLRIEAENIGIQKIIFAKENVSIWFKKDNKVNPEKIINLIQSRKDIQFSGESRLIIKYKADLSNEHKFNIVKEMLDCFIS